MNVLLLLLLGFVCHHVEGKYITGFLNNVVKWCSRCSVVFAVQECAVCGTVPTEARVLCSKTKEAADARQDTTVTTVIKVGIR